MSGYRVDPAGFLLDENGRRVGFKEADGDEVFFPTLNAAQDGLVKPDGTTLAVSGGATEFTALTDAATVDLPAENTPLANALALKVAQAAPVLAGAVVTSANAMAALAIDTSKGLNTKSIAADQTFTFSGAPTAQTWFTMGLANTATTYVTATIPSSVPEGQSAAITSVSVPPSSKVYLTWHYDGSQYNLFYSGVAGTPLSSKSAAYTTTLADANTFIYHPVGDNNARTFTIDSNANVPYEIGTAITFINEINTVTIAITTDTMSLIGAGTTGSRTLAANGMATAIKVTATRWVINGTGLT